VCSNSFAVDCFSSYFLLLHNERLAALPLLFFAITSQLLTVLMLSIDMRCPQGQIRAPGTNESSCRSLYQASLPGLFSEPCRYWNTIALSWNKDEQIFLACRSFREQRLTMRMSVSTSLLPDTFQNSVPFYFRTHRVCCRWVGLFTCILEGPLSNLGRDIGNLDSDFCSLPQSLALPSKFSSNQCPPSIISFDIPLDMTAFFIVIAV
jgi:hypothetical protein